MVNLSQIPPGVMYADLRPHMPSAGVSPPTIDDNVQYTLLIHDEKMAEQRTLHPAGMRSDWVVHTVLQSKRANFSILETFSCNA